MMDLKTACFVKLIKLCLIVVLSATLLASVEIAPEQPVLFIAVAAVSVIFIHFLWKSVQRNQSTCKRQRIASWKSQGPSSGWKKAA